MNTYRPSIKNSFYVFFLFFSMGHLSSHLQAQTESTSDPTKDEPKTYLTSEYATGDWGGFRSQWEEKGVSLGILYQGEWLRNISGGINVGSAYIHNIDYYATFDAGKLLGYNGLTLYLQWMTNNGHGITQYVGDKQVTSNIEAVNITKFYQGYLQQNFLDDRLSFLAGFLDLNSEFYVTSTCLRFLHSSHGIGIDFSQSGLNGPSIFPNLGLAFRARYQPMENFIVHAAVFDALPGDPVVASHTSFHIDGDEGALLVGEVGYNVEDDPEKGSILTKLVLGGWIYTSTFDDLMDVDGSGNPIKRSGNGGLYVLSQRHFFGKPDAPDQGLCAFLRAGIANTDVNRFGFSVSTGATYKGLVPQRDDDDLGLAIALAANGKKYKDVMTAAGTPADDYELNIELYYKLQLTPFFALQLDYQYVVNPNTDPAIDNSTLIGARAYITF
jgi:porin